MLSKVSSTVKLCLLVLVMGAVIVCVGAYGISIMNAMNRNTQTMHADRVLPLQQLSSIRYAYAQNILSTVEELKNNAITFAEAKQQIQAAEKSINETWITYKKTYLTPEEAELVSQADLLKANADKTIDELKQHLEKSDAATFKDIAGQNMYAAINPVLNKTGELVQLQIKVSNELNNSNNEAYNSTKNKFWILIAVALVFACVLSFIILKDVWSLIKNLRERNEEVEESEKKCRTLIENAADAIFMINTETGIVDVNDYGCRLLGYSREELLQMKISEVIPPDEMERQKSYLKLLTENKSALTERRVRRKDGSEVDVEINSQWLEGKGHIAIIRDITDRKKAEAEIAALNESLEQKVIDRTSKLLEANKALEAFSYSVTHDLRTPLRAVIGFTKLIQNDYASTFDSNLKDLFAHVQNNARRMNAIIHDLLLLAKYEKAQLNAAPVDMEKLMKQVWDSLQFNSPHQAKIQIRPLPSALGDESLLEQVVVNLLSNAVKYSSKKEKPVIEVDYESGEGVITYLVKDNGAGFDMKNYDRLFGAFQRLHGMNEFEGTGVGLLLVKRIVERHGGVVWADSKVNEGATFYFTLPSSN